MSKIYKNPLELSKGLTNEEIQEQMANDPFNKLPTQESDYDAAIDAWLNGFDPELLEGVEPSDFGLGFIDDAENSYHDAPIGYRPPEEHQNYIRNKVDELINSKYKHLQPYHRREN